jgi:two-component system OmpR family sensor kinase
MSVRVRLLVGMLLVAVVLGLAAVVVTRSTEAHLVDQVDSRLEAVPPVPLQGRGPPQGAEAQRRGAPSDVTDGEAGVQLSSLYLATVSADASVTPIVTPNLSDEAPSLPAIDGEQALGAVDAGPLTVDSVSSDTRYRVVARSDPQGDGAIVVAASLADVDDAVRRLVIVEVVAVAGVLAVLGLVTWRVIRLGIRPLKAMAATATAIAGGGLSHRVPEVDSRTEAGELGSALNQMLARIERAFDERVRSEARLRDFAADASHELRTPIATIRGYAELYRIGALGDTADLREAMRRTEDEAIRMGSLVDDLLHLVRLDQGRPLERQPVDLAALATDAVRDVSALQPARPITATIDHPGTVLGDEARLRQVVGNIVGNALVHTPVDTPVDVHVTQSEGRAIVEVTDHGPGMTAETASRAFERFYRADPSRSRHQGGNGLGLAIVDATVRAHGGEAMLTSSRGAGTTVRIELPTASRAGPPIPASTTGRLTASSPGGLHRGTHLHQGNLRLRRLP